jgi:hypothetical protein
MKSIIYQGVKYQFFVENDEIVHCDITSGRRTYIYTWAKTLRGYKGWLSFLPGHSNSAV